MGYIFFFQKAGLCKLVGRFNPFSKICSSDLDHFPKIFGVEIPKNVGIQPPHRFPRFSQIPRGFREPAA